MNRLARLSIRAALLLEFVVVLLVAWTCITPGGCNWACTDDSDCASTHSCVDGACWNASCEGGRDSSVDLELEVPILCGNGVVDSGEDCDGTDMTGCLDTQECIDCQCVYVVGCGNGVVDSGEDCDGTDMTGCLDTQECHNCQCVYVVEADACGDGFCNTTTENTDLCPADCVCVDNGTCEPGEGFNCADCGDPAEACGSPCESSETCPDPLSCFEGHCWDGCLCGGSCGEGGEEEEGVECWCVGPDRECSDGTWLYGACEP